MIYRGILTVLVFVYFFSCNQDPDCEDEKQRLQICQEENTEIENQLTSCLEKVDSLEKIEPVVIHDTVVLRDTIFSSDTLYRVDTVWPSMVLCDTIMVKEILLYGEDTNWVIKPYIRCPLEIFQVYTDIYLQGFSTGMHKEDDYEFGCLEVLVNGSNYFIQYGRQICLDAGLEYGQYVTRVMLPVESISTITYIFYNNDSGTYEGEEEDIDVYFYGIVADTKNVFNTWQIDYTGSPGWMDDNTYIRFNDNDTLTVYLK